MMARGAARRSAADAVDSDSEISYRFASRLLPYRYTWKIVPLARSRIRMSRGAAFVGGEGAAGIFMSERRLGFFKSYVRGDSRRSGFEEIYNSRRESESGVSGELTLERRHARNGAIPKLEQALAAGRVASASSS